MIKKDSKFFRPSTDSGRCRPDLPALTLLPSVALGRVAQINFALIALKKRSVEAIKSLSLKIKMLYKSNMRFGFFVERIVSIWATRPLAKEALPFNALMFQPNSVIKSAPIFVICGQITAANREFSKPKIKANKGNLRAKNLHFFIPPNCQKPLAIQAKTLQKTAQNNAKKGHFFDVFYSAQFRPAQWPIGRQSSRRGHGRKSSPRLRRHPSSGR